MRTGARPGQGRRAPERRGDLRSPRAAGHCEGAPELVAAVDAGNVPVKTATELVSSSSEMSSRHRPRTEGARSARRRCASRDVQPCFLRPRRPVASATAFANPPAPPSLLPERGDDAERRRGRGGGVDARPEQSAQTRSRSSLTAFQSDYRRGKNPKEEAPKVDQILAAARTALHAWRWIVIEWNEDKRWDMKFAIHESGQIAMHMNQAVARLEEISAICNGRKPAPPPEGP